MNFDRKLGLTMILAVAAAGCAPVDPGLGEALRYDMAAQTVDPDPVYDEEGAKPGSDGNQGARAAANYRKGTVKAPSSAGTQSGPQ